MNSLSASAGDIIEISGGKRRTVAKCLPLYPSDEGKGVIRIDGVGRSNAGIAIGDAVTITKVSTIPAESVSIVPLEETPSIDERYFADALEGCPIIKGDRLTVPYFGGRLSFEIAAVMPATGALIVTKQTKFTLLNRDQALTGISYTRYEDIGGLKEEIQEVREMIELPLRHPEIFEKLGIEAPKGVLLYGPPGTGKTLLAKAVAAESEANFISVKGPELLSKWVGESERGIREVFRRARQAAPCVVFFDEVDSIAKARGSEGSGSAAIVSQILTELDGIGELRGVVVLAATNRAELVDPALLRPGRFDKMILVPAPDIKTRAGILKINVKDRPLGSDVNLERIATLADRFSGAEVSAIVNTAVSIVLHEYLSKYPMPEEATKHASEARIMMRHFEEAVKRVRTQRDTKPDERASLAHYR